MGVAYKDPLDERARAARRKHYENNKQQYLDRNQAAREACRVLIQEAKDVPCADCGVKYPTYVMDLHHRDPAQKLGSIGDMARRGLRKTQEEIAKCVALCSNCHRERTFGECAAGVAEGLQNPRNEQQGSTPCTPA